ncbi:amidohydrolase [Bernardetia litoralis DSM 6794]|uniref:Amidohydrolase n=1 Tax=Bernardetia litoralis (strain ATCC 23117 / DSM 6794 / NBRC 15988 / NCIMB 1366 / Fx l1 / Sio-4) TaxID=880071 RepID=I4AHL1_BERLS|nr:amidohydrolase [Bernardetia litoralis]AFM03446.1 amidohydrolase [Bernardetia litoralis DSM 6794]
MLNIRQNLHKIAELSNQEYKTAEFVIDFLQKCNPTSIHQNIGNTGIIAIWENENFDVKENKTVAFRAELDALPIPEPNSFEYKSEHQGVSHKCGHDGHMTILLGVAEYLKNNFDRTNQKNNKRIILLFQPAEETGEGALQMLNDKKMQKLNLKIDYFFALHNIPSYKKNLIVCRENTFAAASKGITIEFEGKTSHAAEPQNGNNPALALSELTTFLYFLSENLTKEKQNKDFVLVTVVDAILGETSRKSFDNIAFGVSPAKARIGATLRSYLDEDLELLSKKTEQKAQELADKYDLKLKISYSEKFAATTNTKKSVELIQKTAKKLGLNYQDKEKPFSWSEDFGQFTQHFEGAMFGLGSGTDTPELHHSNYDFPDEITQTGINIFVSLIEDIE